MRLADDDIQRELRGALREWLPGAVAEAEKPGDRDDPRERRRCDQAWQRSVFEAGFAGIDWPTKWGGRGLSALEQLIFLEETGRAGAPGPGVNLVGLMHAGLTLCAMGSPELQEKLVPDILAGRAVWCQGFSEPGAGSDLAAIRTSAVRDGDDYVINGQKIWSTNAHVADWCEIVVRTDPGSSGPKGLSWLALPMNAEGITVRPIRTIDGGADFCEVFYDDVRCPVAHRVGEEGGGWRVSMTTLTHERLLAFTGDLVHMSRLIDRIGDLEFGGDDAVVRHRIGVLKAQIAGCWSLLYRNASAAAAGTPPTFAVSVFKLGFSEIANKAAALAAQIATRVIPSNVGDDEAKDMLRTRLWNFALMIAGGTSQIQKNIISERILGLPKEVNGPRNR